VKKLLISFALFVFSGFIFPSQVKSLRRNSSSEVIDQMNQLRQAEIMNRIVSAYSTESNSPNLDLKKSIDELNKDCNKRAIIILFLLDKRNTAPSLLTPLDKALLKEYDDELDRDDREFTHEESLD